MVSILLLLTISLVGLYLVRSLLSKKQSLGTLPPGPPRKPIIGNLTDLPSHDVRDWEYWLKHKDLYGPISSLSIFGDNIVILNDARFAREILEKRSSVWSSRPSWNFGKMAGWGQILGTLEYSDPSFKDMRKALGYEIGSKAAVSRFNAVQDLEVRRFLFRVLEDPDNLLHHIRKEAGAIVLKVAYGYTIEPHGHDPLVDLADEAMATFGLAILPGTWAVDFIPILKHIPTWFPGAQFARMAKQFRKSVAAFSDVPYAFAKHKLAQQDFEPSFLAGLLQKNEYQPGHGSYEETVIKWAAASFYGGGSDTTVSTMSSFFLVMALFPEAQRKAQAEIDRVVGPDRLPSFQDRENLPYIDAMVKEILRWHPVLPMGTAHTSVQDDSYEGYTFPKGTLMVPNVWAFTHDPNTYPDPHAFKPERFLRYEGHDPEANPYYFVFGFGRRVCPGRTLADANLYISIAQSVAAFTITKPIQDGKEVDLRAEYQAGAISHPMSYKVTITPRSPRYEELIRAVETEHPWETSHAEELKDLSR
ncbi:cytochrome P450 [Aspergillus pseudonomiae]|uniref:Cytochrome P450 n=1 Tax=Aspergillus pseudonomiae TaxID=1506151 RepID=A0A5N6I644_9EURO|nr:cytochrome P450 [Aspergillus pseudonomiae]KAB8261239.1 cytochrome P450 [Aspergillus pseudonomiae]KAE8398089.1 cytochrome P450 [Aspergillus pseudonomiae]